MDSDEERVSSPGSPEQIEEGQDICTGEMDTSNVTQDAEQVQGISKESDEAGSAPDTECTDTDDGVGESEGTEMSESSCATLSGDHREDIELSLPAGQDGNQGEWQGIPRIVIDTVRTLTPLSSVADRCEDLDSTEDAPPEEYAEGEGDDADTCDEGVADADEVREVVGADRDARGGVVADVEEVADVVVVADVGEVPDVEMVTDVKAVVDVEKVEHVEAGVPGNGDGTSGDQIQGEDDLMSRKPDAVVLDTSDVSSDQRPRTLIAKSGELVETGSQTIETGEIAPFIDVIPEEDENIDKDRKPARDAAVVNGEKEGATGSETPETPVPGSSQGSPGEKSKLTEEDEIRRILELEEQVKQGKFIEMPEDDEILKLKFVDSAEGVQMEPEKDEHSPTVKRKSAMDGSEADGEWSETEGEVTEEDLAAQDQSAKNSSPQQVSVTAPSPGRPLSSSIKASSYPRLDMRQLPKYDPVDSIMDRIDAELLQITGYGSLNLPRMTRPDREERTHLSTQGVQFDSADDSDHAARGRSDQDTGLGTAEDNVSERTLTDRQSRGLLSSLDNMTDGTSTLLGSISDIDSILSKQSDSGSVKRASRKKRSGNYLRDSKSKPFASDMESVRTEDFEDRFKEVMIQTPKSTDKLLEKLEKLRETLVEAQQNKQGAGKTNQARSAPGREPKSKRAYMMSGKDSDLDSVKTEDFQREYMKTVVPADVPAPRRKRESDVDSVRTEEFERKYKESLLNVQKSLLREDRAKAIQAAVQARTAMRTAQAATGRKGVPRLQRGILECFGNLRLFSYDNIPSYLKPKPSIPWSMKAMCNGSEDTPRTEDFENNFNKINVKHLAGVPLTSFDDNMIDSDLDTVRSSQVRDRLRGFPGKAPSEMSEDDILEKKYKEYIQKKMAEISGPSRLPPIEPSLSDIESVSQKELMDGRDEYAESDIQMEPPAPQPSRGHRSASPNYPRYGYRDDHEMSTSQDEEIKESTREIKRESRRIQREMEEERRKRMTSTPVARSGRRSTSPTRSAKSMERLYSDRFRSSTPDVSPKNIVERSRSPELSRIARSLEKITKLQQKAQPVEVPSRPLSPDPQKLFEQELKEKFLELEVLGDSIEEAREEKKAVMKELRALSQSLQCQQVDAKNADRFVKESRARCEDARTELMLTEFKRDNAATELDEIQTDIMKRKKRLRDLDDQVKDHNERLREFEDIGMNPEECKRMMAERDVLQSEVSNKDALQMERDELQKTLLATKEDLFNEQKKYRNRLDATEEKLDTAMKRLEEVTTERGELSQKLSSLEQKYAKDMREKENTIQENHDDYELLRGKLQNELQDLHQQTIEETSQLRQELEEASNKVVVLKQEVEHKDELNLQLTNQVIELQTDLTREGELRDKESDGYRKEMSSLLAEKEHALTQLRDQLYNEKQEALDELQAQFDAERRDFMQRSESRLAEQLAQHHHELIARDEENQALREQIRQCEDAANTLQDKVRYETKEQFNTHLEQEKKNWDAERDRLWKRELAKIGDESARAVQKANEDAEREREISQHLEKQIDLIKQELEDQRQQNRQLYKDKLDSLNRVKEMAREERETEVERVKGKLNEENLKEIARLRETIARKDDEISQLRAEVDEFLARERDNTSSADRQDKTVIHEINEDCRKTAVLLGVTPRKIQASCHKRDPSPARNSITAALANLRASNDQLRNYVLEVKQDLEGQRNVMLKLQKEKADSMDELRERFNLEKNRELEMLRERLIKEHLDEVTQLQRTANSDKALRAALIDKDNELREIQRNMNTWKEDVAEKFARKFEDELKRELEKRIRDIKRVGKDKDRLSGHQQKEIERLEKEVTRLTQANILNSCSSDCDTNTIKLLRHLQNRIKELRAENTSLKRSAIYSSTTDLTATNNSGYIDNSNVLKDRTKQAELRAELAEDRASRNETMLTQKMAEVSRLQSALTHQTKELMQLERAYSQLSRSGARPYSGNDRTW
ncbi:repetitive organellar protein-like [Lineus longissimus]|uniref:repetitive organellar protein-like n=1 Tax=Lineus longissimus TaxID=88925 RepID=UPI00315CBE6B